MRHIKKLLIGLTVLATLLTMILTSCKEDDISQVDGNQPETAQGTVTPTASPTPTQKPSLNDIILSGDYTVKGWSDKYEAEWVKMWLDNTYGDSIITDDKIAYMSSFAIDNVSDSFELRPTLYSVSFSSQKPVPGSQNQQDGRYSMDVVVVTVLENGSTILSGFLGPDEFDKYNIIQPAYDVVSKDPRFASRLKPFPKANLPEEFTQIDMRQVSNGYDYEGAYTRILPGGIAAAYCSSPVGEYKYKIGISLYDLAAGENRGYVDIGVYQMDTIEVIDGKLVVKVFKYGSSYSDLQVFTIDSKGSMTSEKPPSDMEYILYSPDKSKYAYSNNGNLYVVNSNGDNPKLLLKGDESSDDHDILHYTPFAWVDNSVLVYRITGYEWLGGGVINADTGKNTRLGNDECGDSPIMLINKRLYTVIGSIDGSSFDPYVIDLSDPSYPYRKIFKKREIIDSYNFESYAFSPDGTKVALFKEVDVREQKYILYICSAEDGSLLKSYEFTTAFNSPQYLDFFENERIAIYPQGYGLSTSYMYIVDLK